VGSGLVLCALTERMREETFSHLKGWSRLSQLLIRLSQFNKAQQVCEVLLDQASDEREEADLYYMLRGTKHGQGEYTEAIIFYEKSIILNQRILSPTNSDLTILYNNIGMMYCKMNDYSKALSFFERVVNTGQRSLLKNHSLLQLYKENLESVKRNCK
jgi:tetratricopeptide (TPR) repeat protein